MPKTPDSINDGTKLALFLKEIKLMQLSLANEMKMPPSTMGRYVSGFSRTPQKVIDHLYKKHNLNLQWWATGKGSKVRSQEAPRGLVTDIGMFVDKLEALTRRVEHQEQVIKKLARDLYSRDLDK